MRLIIRSSGKLLKPFLPDKVTTFPEISLVERGEIISDESKVANPFSHFFENAIRSLGIKANLDNKKNETFKNIPASHLMYQMCVVLF